MATYDELFNRKTVKYPKWENAGDVVVGIQNGPVDPVNHQIHYKTKRPLYLVKVGVKSDGNDQWESREEGTFDWNLDNFALTQIRVPVIVQVKGDENYESFFDFPDRSPRADSLKVAMMDSGLPLIHGTAIAIKLIEKTKPAKWITKLKAPSLASEDK